MMNAKMLWSVTVSAGLGAALLGLVAFADAAPAAGPHAATLWGGAMLLLFSVALLATMAFPLVRK